MRDLLTPACDASVPRPQAPQLDDLARLRILLLLAEEVGGGGGCRGAVRAVFAAAGAEQARAVLSLCQRAVGSGAEAPAGIAAGEAVRLGLGVMSRLSAARRGPEIARDDPR